MHFTSPADTRSRAELLDAVAAPSNELRIVIRLLGGEELQVGTALGREAAMELARRTTAMVDEAVLERTWPEFDDRLLRPGAIVSVDIQRS